MRNIFKVLALLLLAITSIHSVAYAQFTQVSYAFPEVPDESTLDEAESAEDRLYHVESMAANGYGQWIASRNSSLELGNLRWALLANAAHTLTNYPSFDVPTGMVESGALVSPDTKVTANLKGQVRYVNADAGRIFFEVRGLDESDIDISFQGIPHPDATRQPVKSPLHLFPPCSTTFGGVNRTVLTGEGDYWLDEFDVACDAQFLYIVWAYRFTAPGVTWRQVYVTVTDLATGTTQAGFPKLVADHALRPTIACDVRNSGAIRFDIAYIRSGYGGPDIVEHYNYDNGTISTQTLPLNVLLPTQNPNLVPPASYSGPKRARIVVGSVAGSTTPRKCVYVIRQFAGIHHLYQYQLDANNTINPNYAFYVDGDVPGLPTRSAPVNFLTYKVVDNPIRAFANPYDGQATGAYNEFHCLYQIERVEELPNRPLMIVRGHDNGAQGTSDTRTCVSRTKSSGSWALLDGPTTDFWQETANPFSYAGAVNQAGIHVQWSTASKRFYSRDLRRFDEQIEENTLASYKNIVSNGSSHGGTNGALLPPGKRFTLWTDPFFGVFYTGISQSDGFYTSNNLAPGFNSGHLLIDGYGTKFTVGDGTATMATLVTMPNTVVEFGDEELGEELKVHSSQWDFYGVPSNTADANVIGPGNVYLLGGDATMGSLENDGSYPDEIDKPAILNIHAGAEYVVQAPASLSSYHALINLKYAESIKPAFRMSCTTENCLTTGLLKIKGKTTLEGSRINSFIPSGVVAAINIEPNDNVGYATALSHFLRAENSYFYNTGSGYNNIRATGTQPGLSVGVADEAYGAIEILEGLVDKVSIGIENPTQTVNIDANTLISMPALAVSLSRTRSFDLPYQDIFVQRSTIISFLEDDAIGIKVSGFNNKALQTEVQLIDNSIVIYDTGTVSSGILIDNSSIGALDNTVGGSLIDDGIAVMANASPQETLNSLLCSNSVFGNAIGISTAFWDGYSKLNLATNCGMGHKIEGPAQGHLVFENYYDNVGPGLYLSNGNAEGDLRGVDPSGTFEYAGHNRLIFNDLAGTEGQIHIYGGASLLLNVSGNSNYGKNTLIANAQNDIVYGATSSGIMSIPVGNNFAGYGSVSSPIAYTTGQIPTTSGLNLTGTSLTSPTSIPSVSCGGGFSGGTAPINPTLAGDETDPASCSNLQDRGRSLKNQQKYQQSYDTLKQFIDSCATQPFAPITFVMQSANASSLSVNNRNFWEDHREWLKKVLYYSSDTNYYCYDADAIITSFVYFPGRGFDQNGALAVMKYLLESGKCPELNDRFIKTWGPTRDDQIHLWQDTVTNPELTPFDSTLPTIEDLGLGILRGPQGAVGRDERVRLEWLAVPNPFVDQVSVNLNAPHPGIVRVELFDVLGRSVQSRIEEYIPMGPTILSYPVSGMNAGSYLLRVEFDGWQVRTQRIEKQ